MSLAGPAAAVLGPRGPAEVDRAWADLSAAALAAHEANDPVSCIAACRAAGTLLIQLPPDDPRRAASLNNLGLAALLSDAGGDARRGFLQAGIAWRRAKAWVAAMALPSPARSSLHHLRLEARHRDSYAPLLRERQLRLLAAGRAASLFNAAVAARHSDAAIDRAVALRLRALGPQNPEAARMRDLQAGMVAARGDRTTAAAYRAEARRIADSPARSALELWQEIMDADADDSWRLKAAVHLTLVLKETAG